MPAGRNSCSPPWPMTRQADIRLPPPDFASYLKTDSIAGRAYRTNQIYVARGAPRRGVPEEEFALHCTVPLTTRNRTLGVLTIWRTKDESFSDDDIAIVRIFGNTAALAIEQVRLLTEERDRTRRMETLTEVARIISAATDHDALYEAVYAQCVRLFGVEHLLYRAHAARWQSDPSALVRLRAPASEHKRGRRCRPVSASVVVRENTPINTPDASAAYSEHGLVAPQGEEWTDTSQSIHLPWVGVPIREGDQATGVIATNGRATPYTDEECAVLLAIADQVGVAMRNIDLLEGQRDRAGRMEKVTEISRTISAATDLSTLYEAVHQECGRLFSVESFYIAHLRETTGEMIPDLWYTRGTRLLDMEGEPLDGGLSPIVAQTRTPLITDDYIAECKRRGIPIYYPTDPNDVGDAWMGFPLLAGATLLGVMVVNGKRAPYTAEEQEVFEAIVNQVAVAIANARLLKEKEARAARMATLAEVSRAISAMTDPDALYDVVYRECGRLLPMANSRICRIIPETGEIIAESYFRHGERVRELEGQVLRGGLSPAIRDTGEPLLTNDYPGELVRRGMAHPEAPLPPSHSSWLGVPVIQGDEVYGIISLNTADRQLTTEDRDTLLSVANQVGIAMANARLIARERERAARMATLTEIARSISATTDRETLYNAVYTQCARLFRVESLRITRVNAETGEQIPEFWYIDGARRLDREGIPLNYGLSFVVAETRRPFNTSDYYTERIARGIPVSKPMNGNTSFEAKAWLGVPMLAGDELLGVIAIYGKASAYTADEEEAFVAIVNQVSVALQNVELIERERSRVERLAVLNDMSRAMSAVLDMDDLLHVIQQETPRLFPSQSLLAAYWDDDRAWFHEESRNEGVKRRPFAEIMAQRALTEQVVETGETLIIRDYESEMTRRGRIAPPLPVCRMAHIVGGRAAPRTRPGNRADRRVRQAGARHGSGHPHPGTDRPAGGDRDGECPPAGARAHTRRATGDPQRHLPHDQRGARSRTAPSGDRARVHAPPGSALPAHRLPRRQRGLDHRHRASPRSSATTTEMPASAHSPRSSCGRGRRSSCRIMRRRAARTAAHRRPCQGCRCPSGGSACRWSSGARSSACWRASSRRSRRPPRTPNCSRLWRTRQRLPSKTRTSTTTRRNSASSRSVTASLARSTIRSHRG